MRIQAIAINEIWITTNQLMIMSFLVYIKNGKKNNKQTTIIYVTILDIMHTLYM